MAPHQGRRHVRRRPQGTRGRCQRGFDRYYGLLDAFTNLHHPHRLVEDNHTVEVDQYPDGYYLTDDLTDRAHRLDRARPRRRTRASRSSATSPTVAVHAPLHAQGRRTSRATAAATTPGWDALRRAALRPPAWSSGCSPPGTELPPRNAEAGRRRAAVGRASTPADQALYARYMEVFAAMVDSVDQSGRPPPRRRSTSSASSTTRSSCSCPTTARRGRARRAARRPTSAPSCRKNVKDLEDRDVRPRPHRPGSAGPQTLVHYPRGWAMASNTPFRLYKINTHAGGHSVPFLLSLAPWRPTPPAGHGATSGRYVTDVLPTLLRAVRRRAARRGATASRCSRSTGTSLVPVLADPAARHDRGTAVPRDGRPPRLLRRRTGRSSPATSRSPRSATTSGSSTTSPSDRTELRDLAAEHPERVAELAAGWEAAARANQVYPLEEGSRLRYVVRPPYEDAARRSRCGSCAGTHTLERYRSQLLIQWRVVRRRRRAVVPRAATPACWSPTATRAAATRCTSTTATSWSSRTTATAR